MQRLTMTDKTALRARKALRRAISAALSATTERALRRHERRASEARKALQRLDFDARRWGEDMVSG